MEISKQERQWIDRYLSGQLTGAELEDFTARMRTETSFRNEVDLQEVIQKGIQKSYEQHYRSVVISSIRYTKNLIPSGLKLIFIFLLITLSGSLLWFYLAPDTGQNEPRFSIFENRGKTQNEAKVKTEKKRTSQETASMNPESLTKDSASSLPGEEAQNVLATDSSATSEGAGDEIVVRKDEMLIAFMVPVADLNENKSQDGKEDLSNSTAEKLNPSAGLPEEEKVFAVTLATEFWVSPINYRGYRLMNNKLILFGIEEPDHVRLYRMKDNLYMGYQGSYYRLVPAEDFASYQRIKDAEVPLAMRSK